jgi:hypothetical protein
MFREPWLTGAQRVLMTLAFGLVLSLAALAAGATAMALAGALPWPQLAVDWGGAPVPQAGMWAQLAVTGLLLLLCVYLPANARMARLERSHRSFRIGMEDVRRAYETAHAADRRGVFALSSEFEAMRARMDHLRRHPDLADLEPELLELAAQMSHESRDLARIYSDARVARARLFLTQRQEEAARLAERLALARGICDGLRDMLRDVEAAERANHAQLRRLEADLREILPALGYDVDDMRDANVVPLGLTQQRPG